MQGLLRTFSSLALAFAICVSPALAQSITAEAPAQQDYDASASGVEILHAQIDGATTTGIISQNNTTSTQFDTWLADDFVVPDGEAWLLSQVWVRGFYSGDPPAAEGDCTEADVVFYADESNAPDFDPFAERSAEPSNDDGGDLTIDFEAVVVPSGRAWVSVVCNGPNLDAGTPTRWNWFVNAEEAHYEPAHIRNDGGGFGIDPGWHPFTDFGFPGNDLDWYIAGQVAVSTEGGAEPLAFSLLQNAPNPVAGSTDFRFVLNDAAEVSLLVYDALGRTVAQVFSGELAAGEQTISFDASALPAGTYFYRLQSGSQFMARKMTVIN